MVYLTGDTHGDFKRVAEFCIFANKNKDDTLVVLGDAGINYRQDKAAYEHKQLLERLPITLLCIHGNHEQRPETISSYKEIFWNGGIVYAQDEFPSILFAKDGEIYNLDGNKCISIGGAYSVDKPLRLLNGWNWFADEQPSDAVKQCVEQRLTDENWRIDIVLSHTCPYRYLPSDTFPKNSSVDQRTVDNSTEIWLDDIEERLDYMKWYCGHFHIERVIDKIQFMYNDFVSI